ncbi:GNAT family N-acetyltransferase [Isachenkonia alkalipeptolytica]|uniref:N-acetyltransferase domain-containing protein n=1 Tax=Isachenkonia alkalipeptolytica TaxID=2565777 RepID=A0AA43XH69_9CLOT|nr:GNAT family N-acetyltransferase [Isachenkonia alkalipeptolytica]NBG86913.1 hypothetical protein [Isachenkonia alkalipeptolytica]
MVESTEFYKIQGMLEKYKMENINVIGRIRNSEDKTLFIDEKEKPRGFILQDGEWHALFSPNKEVLHKMLQDFEFPEKANFCGIPLDTAKEVLNHLPGYEEDWEEPCYLYYLPKERHEAYLRNHPENLDSIQEKDLDIVDRFYTYRHEGSKEYLRECIANRPSSMIRDEEGNPISWALVREDHSMGVMYTLKEHRKKGLARKVSIDLIKKVIETDKTPYVHIVETNTASCNLASDLGMVPWGRVLWFGMKKKGK